MSLKVIYFNIQLLQMLEAVYCNKNKNKIF